MFNFKPHHVLASITHFCVKHCSKLQTIFVDLALHASKNPRQNVHDLYSRELTQE